MAEKMKQRFELPTEEELQEISPYAQVAYATRCALRVLPLVKVPYDSVITLEKVLLFCSLFSTGTTFSEEEIRVVTKATNNAISDVDNAINSFNNLHTSANNASAAVVAALSSIDFSEGNTSNAIKASFNAGNASEALLKHIKDFIQEARTDFIELNNRYSGTDHPVERDLYSKPLWVQLDDIQVRQIKRIVNEWVVSIQSHSKPFVPIRYWYFFDSNEQGGIPWNEMEKEVREWLTQFKATQKKGVGKISPNDSGINPNQSKLSLNATGAPSSLGSRMSDEDLLGRQTLVDSLAAMIASPRQDTPFTIGLLGDWGAGKSNVMHLLRKSLEERKDSGRFYFADFNAWQYEYTDNMAAGVAQEVLKAFFDEEQTKETDEDNKENLNSEADGEKKKSEKISGLQKFWAYLRKKVKRFWWKSKIRVKFGFRENGWLVPLIMLIILGVAIVSFIMVFVGDSQGWIVSLSASVVILAGFIKRIFTILEHPLTAKINSYLKLPSYVDHLGTIPMLKRHLQTLCDLIIPPKKENPNRLIVFVDDLDRCEPQAISKTLDAIRLVMDIENVVVIIGIDHRIAFRAVEKQYQELADDERTSADIARDYLGKIIQLPVSLEIPTEVELEQFITGALFRHIEESGDTSKGLAQEAVREAAESTSGRNHKTGGETAATRDEPIQQGNTDPQKSIPESEGETENETGTGEKVTWNKEDERESERSPDEDMTETADEKHHFSALCHLFNMHNPRQLIRLRNCYRLLKRIYQPEEEQAWRAKMTMLFWLEFLYAQQQKKRLIIESHFRQKTLDSIQNCVENGHISAGMFEELKREFNMKDGHFETYHKQEKLVRRLVLPHSESPKRAKKEEQYKETEKQESESNENRRSEKKENNQ
jgi:hypothetical protein